MTRTVPSRTTADVSDETVVEPPPTPATGSRPVRPRAPPLREVGRGDRPPAALGPVPDPVSLALIQGIRDGLREHNLFDTNDAASTPTLPPEPPARYLVARSVDGSYNDLSAPAMGMAGTRFGRNVPLQDTEPEDPSRVLTPNPRLVSTRLLARGPEMIPATGLNVLAAAWLQFETRDWFSHGTDATCPFEVPRPPGDDWPTDPIRLPRTRRDPNADADVPRTFVNTETHWWDASQIYGSTREFEDAVRRPSWARQGRDWDRRADRHRPGAARQLRRARRLVGRAGAPAHAVHARHNAVCDMLAVEYRGWSDDEVLNKARLVIGALHRQIHNRVDDSILAGPR